jgi:hypothetical protein
VSRQMTVSRFSRRAAALAATVLVAVAASAVPAERIGAAPASVMRPDRLVILSTTDVKGKTSPCGCHIPKGGFSRRAAFADSLRREYGQMVIVDCGGWFPEGAEDYREVAAFQADELGRSGADAVGIGPRELRYGLGFLRAVIAHGQVPAVSANLADRRTGKLLLPAYRIVKAGGVNVGILSLLPVHVDLGPARDSLQVLDPLEAAYKTVAEMRSKGATVIVLLANLGKVESEDLVASIGGIDAVVAGWNVPLVSTGRTVKGAVFSYGGEQGHFVGVTRLELGPGGSVTGGDNLTRVLGPEIPEKPEVLARVQAFEDAFNEHERAHQRERAAATAAAAGEETETPSHFVGAEVCGRCHAKEYAQWQTTAHSRAWQTLVDEKKESTPDCVVCHVAGYQKPGGFSTAADAAKLANVQCENCHGMGTEHDSWPARHTPVPETTCRGCHTDVSSPLFQFDVFRPHIVHEVPAVMPPLPPRPKTSPMLGIGH